MIVQIGLEKTNFSCTLWRYPANSHLLHKYLELNIKNMSTYNKTAYGFTNFMEVNVNYVKISCLDISPEIIISLIVKPLKY